MNNSLTPKTKKHLRKPVALMHLLVLALLLMSSKCGKDKPEPEPTLPEATMTGANTFGCYINGKLWLPKGNYNYPAFGSKSYITAWERFSFGVQNIDYEYGSGVHTYITGCNAPDIYEPDFTETFIEGTFPGYPDYQEYIIDSTLANFVNITNFDLNEKIISGTFEYNFISID